MATATVKAHHWTVAAVHAFLRGQIGDHRTGDPLHGHAQ